MESTFEDRPIWKRYSVAVVSVAASAILTALLQPAFKEHSTYLPFTLAVIVSSWYGGLGPGLAATVLSFLTADYFFTDPPYSIFPIEFSDVGRFLLFAVIWISISVLTGRLSRAKGRLSLAVEATGVGIFVWLVQKGEIFWTPEMERLYGLEPGSFGGAFPDFINRVYLEDAERVKRELHDGFLNRQPDVVQQFRVVRADGAVRWIEARSHIFYHKSGWVSKVVGTNVDVTEQHQREEEKEFLIREEKAARVEAEHARNALAASNEDLQRFAYAVSHDLRQPLRSIETQSKLLVRRSEAKLDADAHEIASTIVLRVGHMQQLIDSILKYSAVGQGSPADVHSDSAFVLDLALQHLSHAIEESNAEISWDPLPQVTADPDQLLQVFLNLVGNAIKYRSGQSPRIHISARPQDELQCFSVADNGIGIDAKNHDRIFGFFQRLHTSREHEGVGIGLAIVKRIVERQGGRVWVESALGRGSTFYFTLPEPSEALLPETSTSHSPALSSR